MAGAKKCALFVLFVIPLLLCKSEKPSEPPHWKMCSEKEFREDCKRAMELYSEAVGMWSKDAKQLPKKFYSLLEKAQSIFYSIILQSEKPHCSALVGAIVTEVLDFVEGFNEVNSYLTGREFKGTGESPALPKQFVRSLMQKPVDYLEKITSLGWTIVEVGCEKELDVPIHVEIGKENYINILARGVIGSVEILGTLGVAHILNAVFKFILAHNLEFDIADFLENLQKWGARTSAVAFLRSLGFVTKYKGFLEFSEYKETYLPQTATEFSRGFDAWSRIIGEFEKRANDDKYLVTFFDVSGEGKFGNSGEIERRDEVVLNFTGQIFYNRSRFDVYPIKITLSPEFTVEFARKIRSQIEKISLAFAGRVEWFSIEDLNFLARTIGRTIMEDIMRFSPKRYFSNPKPIRSLLPVTAYVEVGGEKFVFFMIEQEVAPYLSPENIFTFPGDAPHFEFPTTDYFIPADCISLPEEASPLEFIPYFAWQDPSFSGSILVRIPPDVTFPICPEDERYAEWNEPDNYSIGKAIAVLFLRYGNLVSPLLQHIVKKEGEANR